MLCVSDCVADRAWFAVPQATKWERIGNESDAAFIGSWPDFVNGDGYSFSTDTSVALIMAKTASPFWRFIRLTEPVVIIEVTGPAAVLMTISETTLSDTICSIVPGK